jgi:hypothetical protein
VQSSLIYFTHALDGRTYGGWYRRLSATEIEVFAIGLMTRATCPEGQELAASRATLEDFVRRQPSQAVAIPPPNNSDERD